MKKYVPHFLSFLLILLLSFLLFRAYSENEILKKKILSLTPSSEVTIGNTKNCVPKEVEYTISGESMTPLIKNGEKVRVLDNYYGCTGKVGRGDIIIYQSSTTRGDIIKQIRAIPGDTVVFKDSSTFINGEILKNSAGQEYNFSQNEKLILTAYLQDGKLQPGSFFAFGDNTQNSIDSRKIGGLGIANFRGKVIFPRK